jgi:hypothetical protein
VIVPTRVIGLGEVDPIVDADDVGAGLAIDSSSSPVPTPKWMRGTPSRPMLGQHARRECGARSRS